jgi:hypothetical protein
MTLIRPTFKHKPSWGEWKEVCPGAQDDSRDELDTERQAPCGIRLTGTGGGVVHGSSNNCKSVHRFRSKR